MSTVFRLPKTYGWSVGCSSPCVSQEMRDPAAVGLGYSLCVPPVRGDGRARTLLADVREPRSAGAHRNPHGASPRRSVDHGVPDAESSGIATG